MIYGVYSVRDVKSGFAQLILELSDEVAERNFGHSVRVSDGLLRSCASDFSLYRIAAFDSDKGVLTPLVPIVHVADATSFTGGD